DRSDDLSSDPRWSRMRDGERWAEVRADDRGRELRMAERREERQFDDTGTRLRIVDRWSSGREERVASDGHGSAGRHGVRSDHRDGADQYAGETRAERRRRLEAESDERWSPAEPAGRGRAPSHTPDVPHPRSASDDHQFASADADRGWRDV